MTKQISMLIGIMFASFNIIAQPLILTPFEISKGKNTATYDECITYYKNLAEQHDEIKVFKCGPTDIGKPLHLIVIDKDKDFNRINTYKKGKRVIMINNGIHPGEPDGVDASMMFVRDIVTKPEFHKLLDNVVIIVIPIYNIDGALNRNSTSRVNQNGPESFGFRGNAANLDLNRDFIKCDSKNARSFEEIFQKWKPDFLVDTHVSDGADYQYTMTYFPTQKDKFNPVLSTWMVDKFQPQLDNKMKEKGVPMCPYVNELKTTPDSGIVGFMESPRYCTGYAALFDCIALCTETHMLKPFDKRVDATYKFIVSLLEIVSQKDNEYDGKKYFASSYPVEYYQLPINWKLDTNKFDIINFMGYEAKYKPSEVSGFPRLYYDEKAPFTKPIRYYNNYIVSDSVKVPYYYIIPQAWSKAIDLLKLNGIGLKRLSKDTIIEVSSYYIKDYETSKRPYENHYNHYNTKVTSNTQMIQYYKGDIVIFTHTYGMRYVMETLEPTAPDSYFNWNFFDGILMQKEWYSDYVFEDIAANLLKKDKALKDSLEAAKKNDPNLAKDGEAQLAWVYHHSEYYEKTHNRYPVGRIMKEVSLPLGE